MTIYDLLFLAVALALPEGSRVIARGRADQLHPALSGGVFGDVADVRRKPVKPAGMVCR